MPEQAEAASPRSLSIVLIHQSFVSPSEAGGTRHVELGRRLVNAGHALTIVASDMSYLTGRPVSGQVDQVVDGVRIVRAPTLRDAHKSYAHRVAGFLSFFFSSIPAALRISRIDLVMGTSPPLFQGASAWLVSAIRNRPFLLEIRDLWPEFAIEIGVLKNPVLIALSRALERFLYNRATHLLVNSPAYRDYLIEKGVSPARISFVPNGVDPDMFSPESKGEVVRAKLNLGDKFIATYAGAMGMANDLDTLLDAAEMLRTRADIHFLFVGDGKERSRLEEQVSQRGLANVTFAGPQPKDRMGDYLAASDACVATLKNIRMFRTVYPNKVFDYMAAGRPTVLGIDGVIREVIERSMGGIFVTPGDASAIAAAITRLADDRSEAKAMGARARSYVVEHFHRDTQGRQLREVVEQVAASG